MNLNEIDKGRTFDWGRTSEAYAKYRDIYPQVFYDKIIQEGLCVKGQNILDLGTGTGVLPRNLYQYGGKFIGTDISENQIKEAIKLSTEAGMNISYTCTATEDINFSENTFDVVTACQCFFYFNHDVVAEKLYNILKPDGKLLILYMAWLPFEDEVAKNSEALILKYNPHWSGCKETRHNIFVPDSYTSFFEIEKEIIYDLHVPFTRESWNGRIIACRGIGASLPDDEVENFSKEHMELLNITAPNTFEVLHYAAMKILKVKK